LGVAAGTPAVTASISFSDARLTRLVPRWAFLVLLLAAELVALTLPFDASKVLQDRSGIVELIVGLLGILRPVFITGAAAIVFLSWDVARDEFIRLFHDRDDPALTSFNWLGVHFIILVPLVIGTIGRRNGYLADPTHPIWWLGAWMILGLAAVATWGAAAIPGQFWTRWYHRSRREFAIGAAFGVVATALGGCTRLLWAPLQKSTFWAVSILLSILDRHADLYPQDAIIRTPTFAVRVGEACSGLEGIGLICAFLTLYLWFSRRELRFPQALLLIPAGAAAIWILNAVRITALVLIGSWNADVAIKGFHSVAGWLFFNLVACGLVYSSSRMHLFSNDVAEPDSDRVSNPAAVYLAPMLTIVAAAMVTQAFSAGFDFLYPLRVVAVAAVLFYYRRELLSAIRFTASWQAMAIGALVFVAWIAIVPADRGADAQFSSALAAMSHPTAMVWIVFRIIGAIVTVPIAEELAFRGYAIRKLISADFESVPPGAFTWLSFAVSSILFGALHGNWVAGSIAGVAFAIALYRRGALSDAVVAHATANALLAAYVLATHSWSLWS
jgi:exosortase E/protease (VPEID-CTERM system)